MKKEIEGKVLFISCSSTWVSKVLGEGPDLLLVLLIFLILQAVVWPDTEQTFISHHKPRSSLYINPHAWQGELSFIVGRRIN